MICVLKVLRGPTNRSSRYVLRENQHVEIGRSTSADISLPCDAHLSRRHVLVDSFGKGFSICDLGSANGTYLNEQRIRRASLRNGDVIRIGMTQFRVMMMEDDANPHAEDGVLFSSSVSHDLGSRWVDPEQREQRSLSSPNVGFDDQTTRCVPQPSPRVESFRSESLRNDLHERQEMIPATQGWQFQREQNELLGAEPKSSRILKDSTEGLKSPSASTHPFFEYFGACEQPNLYTLQNALESPWGSFVGLLLKRDEKEQILSIFNITQVPSHEAHVLDQRRRDQRLVPLSKTILAGKISLSESDLNLLSSCTGCDGLICVGSAQRLDAEELKPHANSFSYPSLLGEHLKDHNRSPLREFLLRRRAWVLFEWSRNGPIGLFA